MKDERKTKAQLIEELNHLRRRLAELTERTVEEVRRGPAAPPAPAERGRDLYRLLVEKAPFGVLLADTRGNLKLVNDLLVEILGSPSKELTLAINLLEFQPLVEAGFSGLFKNTAATGETLIQELEYHSRWGRELRARVILTPVLDEGGKTEGVLGIIEDITRLAVIEEALSETRSRYQTLLELSPEGVLITDRAGTILALNRRAVEILGCKETEELVGAPGLSLLSGNQRTAAAENLKRMLSGEPTGGLEYELSLPDGERAFIEVTSARLGGDADEPAGFVVILRDIAERKRAETELRRSEERLDLVLRGADLGYWVWDIATDEVTYNDRWFTMLGYSPDDLEPGYETWKGLLHPEDRERTVAELEAQLEGRTPSYECEYRMRTADGSWRWILSRGTVLERDESGRPLRAAGTHQDITERKTAEHELRESRRRIESYLDKIPPVLYRADLRAKRFDFLAPSVERMLGHPFDEVVGDFKEFTLRVLHPEDRERVAAEVAEFIAGGPTDRTLEVTARMIRADGRTIWVRDSIRYEWDDQGLRYVNGVMTDITHQFETEQSYRALVEEALVGVYIFQPPESDDAPGRFLFVNDEMCSITGYSKTELLEIDTGELTHPEDRDRLLERMSDRLDGRDVPNRYTMRIQRRDGETAILRVAARPITYRGERAILGNCSDITRSVEAAESLQGRLQQSEVLAELSRRFLEIRDRDKALSVAADLLQRAFPTFVSINLLSPDGERLIMTEHRSDQRLLEFVNKLIGRPLDGWSIPLNRDTVISRTMRSGHPTVCGLDFTPDEPVVQTEIVEMLEAMVEEASPLRKLTRRAAERLGARALLGVPFTDSDGRISGSLTVLSRQSFSRDDFNLIRVAAELIGRSLEQLRLTRELADSEERFRSVFNNIPVGLYRTTPEGRFLMANRTMVEMVGFDSLDELLAHNLEEIGYQPQESREDFKSELEEKGELYGREYRWTKLDGSVIHVRENSRLVRDDAGRVLYYEGSVEDITDRRLAEAALSESEERYRLLAETAKDIIIIHGMDGRIIYVNPACAEKLGQESAELIGRSIGEFLNDDSKEDIEERRRRRESGERGVFSYEKEVPAGDGERLLMEINSSMIEREGEPWAVLLIARDITERRRTEEALRESERRYRSLQENAPLGVYRVNPEGRLVSANPAMCEIFGYSSKEEMLRIPAVEFYVDAERRRELLEKMTEDDRVADFEARLRRKDDSEFIALINIQAVRDAEGRLLYHNGILTDVTERKLAQQALRDSEERFRRMADNIQDGLAIIEDGEVVYVNDRLLDILGRRRDDVLRNITWIDIAAPEERERLEKLRRETIENDTPLESLEFWILRPDGRRRCIQNRYTHSLDEDGRRSRYVVTTDITEHKEAEEELERLAIAIQTSSDAITITDIEGRFIYVNSGTLRLYDLADEEDILGSPFLEWIAPEDHPAAEEALDQVLQSGQLANRELRFLTSNGRAVQVEISLSVLREDDGQPKGFAVVARDIGERKLAENQLRESERRFRTLYENVAGGILIIDENYVIKDVNERTCEITGYTREELVGEFCDIVCPKGSRSKLCPIWAEKKNSFQGMDTTIKCKDGGWTPILKNANRIELDGRTYILENFQDISDRKWAEEIQSVLYNIATSINTCDSLDELFPLIHENLSRILETTNFFIALYDESDNTLSFPYFRDEYDEEAYAELESVPAEKTNSHYVIRTGEPLLADRAVFDELNERGEIITREELARPLIWLGVPLKRGEEVFGVVAVQSYTDARAYNEADRDLLQLVSHQIANAVDELQAEAALKRSEERFKLAARATSDVIYEWDAKNDVLAWYGDIDTILGYTPDEIKRRGEGWWGLIHPEDRERMLQRLGEARRDGEHVDSEYRVRAKDGSWRYWADHGIVVLDDDGELEYLIGAGSDVTERRLAERALRESERFNRAVIEHLPMGISVRDPKGRLLVCNETWKRIWAKQDTDIEEDLRERDGFAFDDRDRYLSGHLPEIRQIYEKGGHLYLPELKPNDPLPDAAQWISQHFYALTDDAGEVERVVILTEDITERKLAEQKELKYISDLSTLTDTALDFVRMDPGADLFSYLAHRLSEMLDGALVSVSEYDSTNDIMRIQALDCADERVRDLIGHFSTDPRGMTYSLSDERNQKSLRGELQLYPFEPRVLEKWGVDRDLAQALKEGLGVEQMASMGLVREGVLYGMVDIALPGGSSLDKRGIVETFLNQASVALQRMLSERALAESREALRQYAENVADVLYRINIAQDRIEFISPAVRRVLGYEVEEVMSRPGHDYAVVLPEAEREGFLAELRRFIAAGPTEEPLVLESRMRRKDGREFWARHSIRFEWNDTGEAVAASGILSDITERKKTELRLAASELRFRRFAGAVTDLIYRYNYRSRSYDFVSPSCEKLTGYSVEEFFAGGGEFWRHLIHPDDVDRVYAELDVHTSHRIKQTRFSLEYRLLHRDGHTIWVNERGDFELDEQGEVRSYNGVVRDITETKRAEEALAASERTYRSLYDTTMALADKNELDAVLDVLVPQASDLLGARHCTYYRLPPDREILIPLKTTSLETYEQVMDYRVPLGFGLTGRTALTGEGSYVNSDDSDRSVIRQIPGTASTLDEFESLICEPIKDGNRVVGVLTLSKLHDGFDARDQDILRIFARMVSIAVKRADNLQALADSENTYRVLYETMMDLADRTELEEILGILVRRAATLLEADACTYYRYHTAPHRLRPLETSHEDSRDKLVDYTIVLGDELVKRCLRQGGGGVYSQDDTKPAELRPLPGLDKTESADSSLIVEPVFHGRECLGAMLLHKLEDRFDEQDHEVIRLFARMAAIAAKRAENTEALSESEETYRRVYETTLALADTEELVQSIEVISEQASRLIDAAVCIFYRFDAERRVLMPIYTNESVEREEVLGFEVPLDMGLTGLVARERKAAYSNYNEGRRPIATIPDTANHTPHNSLISVPIMDDEELLGVMTLIAPDRIFTDDDLERLKIFTRQAEIAIKRARYLAALAAGEETYRRLYDTTLVLADETELQPAAAAICAQAKQTLDSRFCMFFRYDEHRDELVVLEVSTPESREELLGFRLKPGEGFAGLVAQRRRGGYTNFDDEERPMKHVDGTPPENDEKQSILAEPVVDGDNLLGVISCGVFDRRYDDEDMSQLRVFARLAAIAIKRNDYLTALADSEKVYRRLYETTLTLADNDNLTEVLATIGANATHMLESLFYICYIFDEEEQVLRPIHTDAYSEKPGEPEKIYEFRLELGEGLAGRVALERRGDFANYNDPERRVSYINGTDTNSDNIQSVIAEPITDGDKLLGVLTVGQLRRVYNDDDLDKLRIFARLSAVALLRASNLKALAESEEKHRTLVEQATDGVLIIQDGMVKFANTAMERMAGYTREEILGTEFTRYIAPEFLETVADHYTQRMREEDVPGIYEIEGVTKSGERIPLELNAGTITYMGQKADLVLIRDITERRAARERIRQLNSTLRAIRDINQLITVEKDPLRLIQGACDNLTHSHYDGAWIVLTDDARRPVQMTYRGPGEIDAEEASSLRDKELPRCIKKCMQGEGELIIGECSDCHHCDTDQGGYVAVPLEYDKRTFGYLAVGVRGERRPDDEERTLLAELSVDLAFALYSGELEHTREIAERRSRYYVEHISEGVWCYEIPPLAKSELTKDNVEQLLAGVCVECNQALAEMQRRSREELLGGAWRDNLSDPAALLHQLKRFVANDCRLDNQVFSEEREGELRWYIASMFGEIIGDHLVRVWGRQLDITDQRRAEAERDRHHREVQAIFDNMEIMLWSMRLDDEGYLYYEQVNRPFAAVEGKEPEYYNGRRIVDIASEAQVQGMRNRFEHIRDGEVHTYELAFGKGAGRRHFDIRLIPLPNPDGEVRWFIGTAIDITKRQQALEALRESEERYRAFTEEAMVGVYIISEDIFLFVNAQMERITGYSREELLELNPFDLIVEENREFVNERRKAAGRGEDQPREYSLHIRRKSGEIRTVDVRVRQITLEGESAVLGNLVDVTERRRAEEALAESEQRYRSIWSKSPIGICLTNRAGELTIVNPALARILGYAEGELEGRRFYDMIVVPEEHDEETGMGDLLGRTLDTQSYREKFSLFSGKPTELMMAAKDGRAIPVEFTIDFISREGSVQYMIALVNDITERKRAEEAMANYRADLEREVAAKTEQLSTARRYLRDVIDSSGEFITVCDAEGRLEIINRTAAESLGYTEEELLGESIGMLYYQKDLPLVEEMAHRMMQGHGTIVTQVNVRSRGGSPISVELYLSPIMDHQGRFIGSVGIGRDTREIENLRKALLQSEKLAATGKLAASIAHEVNNPLGVIKNYLQIAKMDFDEQGDNYRLLGIIEEEIQRIARIIKGLLDFYRPESTNVSSTNLNRLIEDLLLLVGIQLERRDIRVEKDLDPQLPTVMVSPDQFRQIMLNMVTNAQDAMPEGGALSLTSQVQGDRVLVRIADTGIGIDREHLPYIFDPFFTTKGHKGTGLGLSVSYGIIHNFDGDIKVESTPGEGTTFTISLPAAGKPAEPEDY